MGEENVRRPSSIISFPLEVSEKGLDGLCCCCIVLLKLKAPPAPVPKPPPVPNPPPVVPKPPKLGPNPVDCDVDVFVPNAGVAPKRPVGF